MVLLSQLFGDRGKRCVTSFRLNRAGSWGGGVQKSQARTKGPNEWATFLPLLRLVLLIVRPDGGGG